MLKNIKSVSIIVIETSYIINQSIKHYFSETSQNFYVSYFGNKIQNSMCPQ